MLEQKKFTISYNLNVKNEDQMIDAIKGYEVLIVGIEPVTKKVIESSTYLRIIAKHGAGLDNIDLAAAKKANIKVMNAAGANKNAVADHVFALTLSITRGINKSYNNLKKGNWNIHIGTELSSKTIGIIGTGKIGTEVIKRANGFNMKILAYDLYENDMLKEAYNVKYCSLQELLINSDILTIHTDLNKNTMHLIGKDELKLMKNTAYLVNTSRGGIVDEEALYEGLKENWIQGTALDVFEKEPAIGFP